MRLIDIDKHFETNEAFYIVDMKVPLHEVKEVLEHAPTVKAITVEQLLSILLKYDDYIHTKTYPYSQTMEDIYSKGYEDGWGACLKAIKEELDVWEKENEAN